MTEGFRELNYLQAIVEAQREEMLRDPRVILIGENIEIY
jgi:pyruvate/2-oxoglutarate/acetoin dehydrogenase E1 component